MSNLKLIGRFPQLASPIHPGGGIQNAVLLSLKRNVSTDTYDKIVNGYRRSTFSQEALIDDYLKGDVPKHKIIKDVVYYQALDHVSQLFKTPQKYRPVSFPDLRFYPWPTSSSAEAPFSSSKKLRSDFQKLYELGLVQSPRLTFHNLYNHIFNYNRETIHRIKLGMKTDYHGRDARYWNTAHARSHLVESHEDDKIRMVFGVPKLLLQAEAMFLWPLINHLVNLDGNGPMLWGFETLKGGWAKLYNWFHTQRPKARTFLAFDWRQFDKRAQFEVIDDIHDVLKSNIDFEHGYMPTKDYPETWTHPQKLENLWNWMTNAIKHTPDLLPDGRMYERQHAGIASGFFQTQLLDSIYNAIMIFVSLIKMGINISTTGLKVQGDDSIVSLNEFIPKQVHQSFIDQFANHADRYFGAVLNTKKSKMGNTLNGLPVLGFTNDNGYPTRDKEALLASLLYPERNTDQPRLMARAIGIAWANCGVHSDVYEVCSDVYKRFQDEGFSPKMSGLPDIVKSQHLLFSRPAKDEKIPEEFPTFFETIRHVQEINFRSQSQKQLFWPTEAPGLTNWFISEY
nr:MAG: RNA-dependent RNA polymerase [Aspergillus flavus partitivirus 2]